MALPKLIPSYSHQDYLQWKGDWELWDGLPVSMSPSPSKKHQRAAFELAFRLRQGLETAGCSDCEILMEIDWVVSDKMVVRPDVLVSCREHESKFVDGAPALVAEVLSPSSHERDTVYKRALYREQKVPFYLLVEAEDFQVQVLQLVEDEYRLLDGAKSYDLDLGKCQITLELP